MKKFVLCFVFSAIFLFASNRIYAARMISLQDDTLVTNSAALSGLSKDSVKSVILTGTPGDTFEITEDGVLVKTITLAAASEKWNFYHTASSYKINWSGADTATLLLPD